jgi:PAS domain S-box-containing protein
LISALPSKSASAKRSESGNVRSLVAFFSALLEQITQPFAVVNDSDKLFFCNRAFEALTGYSKSELAGLQVEELAACGKGLAAQIRRTQQEATSATSNTELRTKDGSPIPVEIRTAPLRSPDGDTPVLLMVTNLSERQRLESELRQSQKMEAIGKLAGGVAHDFNNVLTTILGLTESMISGRTAPNAESLREIHHAATHAAELTHSLLAFSRRQVLQKRVIALDGVIGNIAKMVVRLLGEDIRLEIACEKSLSPIRADQAQLEQVLLNLCLNARDAMPKGGELRIEARRAELSEEWSNRHPGSRPGSYVALSVRDTGEGMDEETLRRVFEPFFTRKAPGKGTGLGLSLVYGIVKQHEGFIDIRSKAGEGTEFVVYFPPSSGAIETPDQPVAAVTERGSATVLVVEDEKNVRRLIVEVLSNLGYRTFAAANGEEAVKVFERWAGQIDLVLLDAILPKKGGREVYEQILSLKPAARFLFISGYNEVFINEKFEMDPSFDFLRKPFTTVELASRVRNALQPSR